MASLIVRFDVFIARSEMLKGYRKIERQVQIDTARIRLRKTKEVWVKIDEMESNIDKINQRNQVLPVSLTEERDRIILTLKYDNVMDLILESNVHDWTNNAFRFKALILALRRLHMKL